MLRVTFCHLSDTVLQSKAPACGASAVVSRSIKGLPQFALSWHRRYDHLSRSRLFSNRGFDFSSLIDKTALVAISQTIPIGLDVSANV
jgi:hypothetical protein